MPKLTIDNREVEFKSGMTIVEAGRSVGIEIPTMCWLEGCEASTSCMVCAVKVNGNEGLVPACGTVAIEGMEVENDSDEVRAARKMALELLLSDHPGDCMGPCHVTCAAGMDIPVMIRQIGAGKLADAIETVKRDIAMPAVLGRICPAPCEKSCRRGGHDGAVSICLLKRYVADVDLWSEKPFVPKIAKKKNKRVGIIGAGPAGLAAGYYLGQMGYECVVFDGHEKAGGMLRYGVSRDELGEDVLDREISLIEAVGVELKLKCEVGKDISFDAICSEYDAVFVASGATEVEQVEFGDVEVSNGSIKINRGSYATNVEGVFAGGDVTGKRRLAVRAGGHGKEAAAAIDQYLRGEEVVGPVKPFNTRIGKLDADEMEFCVGQVNGEDRLEPAEKWAGFSDEQATVEAGRCLHCDCRKPDACKLRQYSLQYSARAGRFKGKRRKFVQIVEHPEVIFEPGKCIDCGLCVQIAEQAGEELGLSFIGRGFDVRVETPFGRGIAVGLRKSAKKCAEACPTGAIALKTDI